MVKAESKIQSSSTNNPAMSHCKKKYKGVRMRSWGSFVSEIRAPNQKTRIWLGSYSTPEAAARAYDAALLCLKGSSANNLNFPLSKLSYQTLNPDNAAMSPKSIQRAAANAAANPDFFEKSENLNDSNSNSLSPSSSCYTSSSMSLNDSNSSLSPSLSSSSPESRIDDDQISLAAAPFDYEEGDYKVQLEEPGVLAMSSWYNFDSPKYNEMLNGVFFDPSMMTEDCYEDSDIRLWSFC